MKKFSLFLLPTATLVIISPAVGQYMLPPPGVWINPAFAPGYTSRGYRWREQRLYEDPRRNNYIVEDR
jgi:hypothetical protein